MTNNEKIRSRIKQEKLKQWQVADEIGVDESTLSKMFRHELSEENFSRISVAIDVLVAAGRI